ncbi:MAG: M15 family metallopeptidase, partial [Actinomycetota bacterium]|nr:M15 family metallopeptidase [Actinomycetota bacterium]
LLGGAVPVTSGFRSRAEQVALYANRASNPYPVAVPGTSRHEMGQAVDVPLSFVPRLLSVAAQVGLCQPYPRTDPVHFELCARGLP